MSRPPELTTMTIAIAFLLEANIIEHIVEALAEAVATKTVTKEEGEVDAAPPKMHVIGLKAINGSAYVIELDTADSTHRFWGHAASEWVLFEDLFKAHIEVIKKSFNLIA
ncbi:hypothetical protein C0989_011892 [Termitomyces sp. Mn162]|nr:hypothetical protein C0989_011892 [Termitomyces sp. Mn162]